ncbi:GtrA family protein [Xanthomonas sp. NCPPB 2654]|uniref:GtrA family protein n=1 Tax=unclassified Xanthomonas TaxID=2643310 RepID=UPI0021E0C87D|nr:MULTISPECIES: GtrA family protein [unclassified Xanthomonas]MDL5366161.1 GtrA family protein [Xanthomonas sp. NCPPB 2654]UYC21479.1 GtrA family protein [Xanthomonas sp. CFBP 8443]
MKMLRTAIADPRLRQFVLYAVCGGTGVLVDLSLYTLLVWLDFNYQAANAAGYAAGTLVSFALNRHFTFQAYDKTLQRLGLFFAAALVGYLASSALLWLLVGVLGWAPLPAKVATLFFVLILQFSLNRAITFKASMGKSSK